jgi:hypothetical protein
MLEDYLHRIKTTQSSAFAKRFIFTLQGWIAGNWRGLRKILKQVKSNCDSRFTGAVLHRFDGAERQDPRVLAFLRLYSRILVVDNRQDPVFDRQRLASYLVIQKEVPWEDLTVLFCNPK